MRGLSRYIEADKVLMALRLDHKDVIYIDKNDTARRIEKIQGIDIVRCKECLWYKDYDGCFFSTAEVEPNGYCSYGERKSDE